MATGWTLAMRAGGGPHTAHFNLPAGQGEPNLRAMFDTIKAELATATDKLAHLRRFL